MHLAWLILMPIIALLPKAFQEFANGIRPFVRDGE
jgi:hypothetical protein